MSAKRTKGKPSAVGRAVTAGGVASYHREAAAARGRRTDPYRVSFVPDRAVLERARDAAYALSGPPLALTLTRLLNDALLHEVERLEQQHHKGKPFPTRPGKLTPGRRVGG